MQGDKRGTVVMKQQHRIPPMEDRDTPLGLQEARPADGRQRETPIILLHGATFGSAMFDIAVPGYSMQNFLAALGWRNFAMDIRGYGRSMPSPILDAPAQVNPPYARLAEAVNDLRTVFRFVLNVTGGETAHLISFSWGTVVACAFAASQPVALENLILYAPLFGEVNDLWIDRISDPNDRSRVDPSLGAYRWIDEPDVRARWDADIPKNASVELYRDERVLHAIVDGLVAADPGATTRSEKSFRAPTGAMVDLFETFNGRPLYQPRGVIAPTLIIRGQEDTTSTASDAQRLFELLGTSCKRYVAISPGTHFLCAERNAADLFAEIDLFLGHGPDVVGTM